MIDTIHRIFAALGLLTLVSVPLLGLNYAIDNLTRLGETAFYASIAGLWFFAVWYASYHLYYGERYHAESPSHLD